ncbi:1-Cys peroxiredoxin isoform X2 [Cephus cinctus]|nr:1-Cys peroxiredoxin isoform X2 [Cephus cinctus]
MAMSCNSIDSHKKWIEDIKSYAEISDDGFPYPIIADEDRALSTMLGMLDPAETDNQGLPLSARAVFIIDSQKKMRLSILYPATTGRSFDEIIRVIESLQLTDKYKVATPVDWKKGDDVMVQPTVSKEEANDLYADSLKILPLPSGKPYLRIVPQPTDI